MQPEIETVDPNDVWDELPDDPPGFAKFDGQTPRRHLFEEASDHTLETAGITDSFDSAGITAPFNRESASPRLDSSTLRRPEIATNSIPIASSANLDSQSEVLDTPSVSKYSRSVKPASQPTTVGVAPDPSQLGLPIQRGEMRGRRQRLLIRQTQSDPQSANTGARPPATRTVSNPFLGRTRPYGETATPAVSSTSDEQRTTENKIKRRRFSGDYYCDVEVVSAPQASQTAESRPVLSHVDASGKANMVDVSAKPATQRSATAHAQVVFSNDASLQSVVRNSSSKGDILAVARIAGIMAAKRTAELIPLCHPLAITNVDLVFKLAAFKMAPFKKKKGEIPQGGALRIYATVSCTGPTGVEMEALTAANVAALTVYDMCKAVDKEMEIKGVRLCEKSGGRSGTWRSEWYKISPR
jgi:molybdenum cofactor biosynthesis protein MoaC